MTFQLNKQPQEVRTKIRKNMDKINSLNSTQLLEYSKSLNDSKEEIDTNTRDYLFRCVELRTVKLNSGFDVKHECRLKQMVQDFLKKMK